MIDISQWVAVALEHGPPVAVAILVVAVILWLIAILLDEDRSAIFRSRVFLALYKVAGRREDEKLFISNDIMGRLNLARRRLHRGGVPPERAVDVRWIETGSGSTFDVSDGEFVVKLCASDDQRRNIATLALAITKRTTLRGVRHVIREDIQTAVDLNVARRLLKAADHAPSLSWFLDTAYRPAVSRPEVAPWNEAIVTMEDRQYFVEILLPLLDEYGQRIAGLPPRPFMIAEPEAFIRFMQGIATKDFRVDVPLDFKRGYMDLGVVLVGKRAKLLEQGVEPYVRAVGSYVERGYSCIVVIAPEYRGIDRYGTSEARRLIELQKELRRRTLEMPYVTEVDRFSCSFVDDTGERNPGVCTRYRVDAPGC